MRRVAGPFHDRVNGCGWPGWTDWGSKIKMLVEDEEKENAKMKENVFKHKCTEMLLQMSEGW